MDSKYINKKKYILDNYLKLGLNEKQVVLLCLSMTDTNEFKIDYDMLKDKMNLSPSEVTEILSNLFTSSLLNVTLQKNGNEHIEVVDISKLFSSEITNSSSNINIFADIEREFGKSLSSKEVEIISKWISVNKYSETEIINAIGIAVVNNVRNLNYVEKILQGSKKDETTPMYIRYNWVDEE